MATLRLKKKRLADAGGAIVVLPEGDLVAATCSQFERFLTEVFRTRVRGVAIDLSKVAFMSSAAMGILIECVERVRDSKGWFGVVGAAEPVRSAIEVLGLSDYLHLSASLDELLAEHGVAAPKRRGAPRRARPARKRKGRSRS